MKPPQRGTYYREQVYWYTNSVLSLLGAFLTTGGIIAAAVTPGPLLSRAARTVPFVVFVLAALAYGRWARRQYEHARAKNQPS